MCSVPLACWPATVPVTTQSKTRRWPAPNGCTIPSEARIVVPSNGAPRRPSTSMTCRPQRSVVSKRTAMRPPRG
jgi:hypothetical protein